MCVSIPLLDQGKPQFLLHLRANGTKLQWFLFLVMAKVTQDISALTRSLPHPLLHISQVQIPCDLELS